MNSKHQEIFQGAIFRWLDKHPVFFCDQVNAALRDSADKWLGQHSDEVLDYLRDRLSAEVESEENAVQKEIEKLA